MNSKIIKVYEVHCLKHRVWDYNTVWYRYNPSGTCYCCKRIDCDCEIGTTESFDIDETEFKKDIDR